jgi:hypothetical protein
LEPLALVKTESAQALSTLFGDTSNEIMKEDPQTMTTMTSEATDLLTKTLMVTCRIMSPSPQLSRSELWDHYPGSSMEIGPKPMPSSLNSWDT